MSRQHTRGAEGERLAQAYLTRLGYTLIAKNWKCKSGEIDLIMDDPEDNCRVMVEVRLRAPTMFGEGEETVAWSKQQKLIRAAKVYQQTADYWGFIRFDVIAISEGSEVAITHIQDAFVEG